MVLVVMLCLLFAVRASAKSLALVIAARAKEEVPTQEGVSPEDVPVPEGSDRSVAWLAINEELGSSWIGSLRGIWKKKEAGSGQRLVAASEVPGERLVLDPYVIDVAVSVGNDGGHRIGISFDQEGSDLLSVFSKRHVGKAVFVVLNGVVVWGSEFMQPLSFHFFLPCGDSCRGVIDELLALVRPAGRGEVNGPSLELVDPTVWFALLLFLVGIFVGLVVRRNQFWSCIPLFVIFSLLFRVVRRSVALGEDGVLEDVVEIDLVGFAWALLLAMGIGVGLCYAKIKLHGFPKKGRPQAKAE